LFTFWLHEKHLRLSRRIYKREADSTSVTQDVSGERTFSGTKFTKVPSFYARISIYLHKLKPSAI